MAAPLPAAPTPLQTSGHEVQLLSASFIPSQNSQYRTARQHPHHPARAHRAAFIIAKPPTGSLKLIIGILQNNLKTCAFFAHPDRNGAPGFDPEPPPFGPQACSRHIGAFLTAGLEQEPGAALGLVNEQLEQLSGAPVLI